MNTEVLRLQSILRNIPEYEKVVIALSGDVGFYSGAKGLLKALDGNAEIICGISSVVYFMSKIGLSWDDAKIVSAHGRVCNLVSLIRNKSEGFCNSWHFRWNRTSCTETDGLWNG